MVSALFKSEMLNKSRFRLCSTYCEHQTSDSSTFKACATKIAPVTSLISYRMSMRASEPVCLPQWNLTHLLPGEQILVCMMPNSELNEGALIRALLCALRISNCQVLGKCNIPSTARVRPCREIHNILPRDGGNGSDALLWYEHQPLPPHLLDCALRDGDVQRLAQGCPHVRALEISF